MVMVGVALGTFNISAEEVIEDTGISVYSLGDKDQNILVRGRKETVGDYGNVVGYEATSYLGTGYVIYRDDIHHCMTVTTSEGTTEGYCMQPYVIGPSTNAYVDYNYEEGLGNSSIFAALDEEERERWKTTFVIATKYAFGGYKADPNYTGGSNYHDGGTYGTYIINRNGKQEAVCGLMIGGKVYPMTDDEARALTQTIVHYVGNRGSQYNITDFQGHTNSEETSSAFKHLKAYADSGSAQYLKHKNIKTVAEVVDNYEPTKAHQSLKWYVFDYEAQQWVEYNDDNLSKKHIGEDGLIKIKVDYYSKNLCNKLVVNSENENMTIKYNYEPYVVSSISDEEKYYDYIGIMNHSDIPVAVTYEKIASGKETIENQLLNNTRYEIDTFSQTAYIDVNVNDYLKSQGDFRLSVVTGEGTTAGDSYDSSIGKYGTRMYSSPQVQDCLFLASNKELRLESSKLFDIDVSGKLRLSKVSARPDITDNNPCYSMSGAVYNVYAVQSDKDVSKSDLVGTFVINHEEKSVVTYSKYNPEDESDDGTDSNKNQLTKLPLGWYMVCEEKVPANGSYKLDENKYYRCITSENYESVSVVESNEEPSADPIPFEIIKQCSEGQNVGAATLEGAEFTVWYYKGEYENLEEIENSGVEYDRKWIFGTKISENTNNATCIIHEDLLLDGSYEPYLNSENEMILPLGTIVVKETKEPQGYTLDDAKYSVVNTIDGTVTALDGVYVSPIKINQGTVKLSVGNKILVSEEPIRGDLKFIKNDKHTGKPMAGIPFQITSVTTGESHIIVTDKNGVASTSNDQVFHSINTNGNDNFNGQVILEPTGVWFVGNDGDGKVNDGVGALPYDTYKVKELSCKANEDYYLSEEFQISITEDEVVYEYGEIINVHKPEIGTEVFDLIDMDKSIVIGGTVSVIDKVSYEYLEIGKTYVLKGIIINKTTGEEVVSGDKIVVSEVEFTPETENGIIEVPFEFELVCCKGDKLVVYEFLYEKETGEQVASHEDIECENQTLTIETHGVKNEIIKPEVDMVVESPKTGDGFNLAGVVIIMMVAVAGLCSMIIIKRKDR